MIFGYNTDVKAGAETYHVQTEDRGAKHPVIDSVIYNKGRILDRKRTPYTPADVSPEEIKEMVTAQHRMLVESIKAGAFVPGAAQDMLANLAVELLNPDSVSANGRLLFRLKAPAGARVQAYLEVNNSTCERSEATADKNGDAEVTFLMPEGAKAAVLFRAVTDGVATQTVKFEVRQQ
jgi:hypothetical protein